MLLALLAFFSYDIFEEIYFTKEAIWIVSEICLSLKMPTFLSALSTLKVKQKTIYLETAPDAHFCPCCGFRMHSRGTKNRKINHPILQDNYKLVLILKQRRWRCTNPDCLYDISDSFKFVSKNRRTTNATDMLIVDAYRNLAVSSGSISKRFLVADSYALDVFDRYV